MSQQKPETGLLNLVFNIALPVFILHKASAKLGAGPALVIALAFPLLYGIYDLVQRRKWNPLSILGFTNTLFTGGLAFLGLGGLWFSVKEASFPFLIGAFVWWSSYRDNPFVKAFLFNSQALNVAHIEENLKLHHRELDFLKHLQMSTRLLAGSFFVSAVLNFVLAQRVFVPLDLSLGAEDRALALNHQIAEMASLSPLVIVLPSLLILMAILWHLIKGIRDLTGLKTEEILKG